MANLSKTKTFLDTSMPARTLVIGLSPDQMDHGDARHVSQTYDFMSFDDLSCGVDLTAQVISPLMADRFDAGDVATALRQRGYKGELIVMAPPLPRPEMVQRELAQMAPDMSIRLVRDTVH